MAKIGFVRVNPCQTKPQKWLCPG